MYDFNIYWIFKELRANWLSAACKQNWNHQYVVCAGAAGRLELGKTANASMNSISEEAGACSWLTIIEYLFHTYPVMELRSIQSD